MATICEMTASDLEALLGRPLSSVESSNFKLYFDIAKARLNDLICQDVCTIKNEPDPVDLKLVLARIFDVITRETKLDRTINSKKVEDFTISYNNSSVTSSGPLFAQLVNDNSAVIIKYSACAGEIRHGKPAKRVCDDDCI